MDGAHEFCWSSLWEKAQVNPLNGKSYTFPIFRVWDMYSTAFWLATLGFFVAFLSWFAFSPLVPEAVRDDLQLTQAQVINSNLASLGGTAIVRLIAGPACDRFGPRKVMAALLILGAIPSGLAALVTNIGELEAVRFFISILGGTFVPCQAWTTTFFDKSVVGTANAFAGGWGNLGGGVTVAVMIGLYETYVRAGFSSHLAWRICFPTVPVPCLLLVAGMVLLFGKDHPAGKWSNRHHASEPTEGATVGNTVSVVDTAQSEPLTLATFLKVIADPRVWMCFMCYLLTFGLETALDAGLPGLVNTLFASDNFTHVDAAYAASTYGLLNLFARPVGGVIADMLYSRWGLKAKVWWLLGTALSQGIAMIGLGMYINYSDATLGGVIGFIVLIAVTGFAANGACYAVYGHLRPKNIGAVAGLVGAGGNIGGLFYTLIFRYQPGRRVLPTATTPGSNTLGTKFWISGIVNFVGVLPFFFIGLGDAV
ncbi:major facilitator superfamily domain-containing protein [Stachybotrys elegans]|uniref:Nitrate/nitrite transporter n=1 Tax=Stachybotrys elegans TaxID=80388 RepID=A0A8K0SF70_9HYPO|nr:major facilitator superfamily domain-containing protein [Stachybotrys elegans]